MLSPRLRRLGGRVPSCMGRRGPRLLLRGWREAAPRGFVSRSGPVYLEPLLASVLSAASDGLRMTWLLNERPSTD